MLVVSMDSEAGPTLEQSQPPAPSEDGVRFSQIPLLLFIRGLLAVSLMVTLIAALHYYLGTRLITGLELPAFASKVAWVALWAGFASMPLGFSARAMPKPFSQVIQWTGFIWMGTFGVLLSTTAASDLVRFGLSFVLPAHASWQHTQALVVLGLSAVLLVWGFFSARGTPTLERVTVKVPGLPAELDGLKIAQISDIHIGETLGRDFLSKIVAQVNRLEADVVAVTGDLVDGSVRKLRDEVAPLGGLEGRHGVYFVTGNHEYYSGADAWEHEVRRLGLTVLHNEHRVVERGAARLVVAGVPDLEGARFDEAHRPDAAKAFAGAPEGCHPHSAGASAALRPPRAGARREADALGAHPRGADLPLHGLRAAPAARHPGAEAVVGRAGVHQPRHRLLGSSVSGGAQQRGD